MSENTFEPGQLAVLKNNIKYVVTIIDIRDKNASCVNMEGIVVGIPLIALLPLKKTANNIRQVM